MPASMLGFLIIVHLGLGTGASARLTTINHSIFRENILLGSYSFDFLSNYTAAISVTVKNPETEGFKKNPKNAETEVFRWH